mmetsp:Transcript_36210/g.59471  ORF Transcript_36210/g.59471 Transcript_36210/m.59471 type:complete len:265 (+) Transcript_36210:1811-2605(+)
MPSIRAIEMRVMLLIKRLHLVVRIHTSRTQRIQNELRKVGRVLRLRRTAALDMKHAAFEFIALPEIACGHGHERLLASAILRRRHAHQLLVANHIHNGMNIAPPPHKRSNRRQIVVRRQLRRVMRRFAVAEQFRSKQNEFVVDGVALWRQQLKVVLDTRAIFGWDTFVVVEQFERGTECARHCRIRLDERKIKLRQEVGDMMREVVLWLLDGDHVLDAQLREEEIGALHMRRRLDHHALRHLVQRVVRRLIPTALAHSVVALEQ